MLVGGLGGQEGEREPEEPQSMCVCVCGVSWCLSVVTDLGELLFVCLLFVCLCETLCECVCEGDRERMRDKDTHTQCTIWTPVQSLSDEGVCSVHCLRLNPQSTLLGGGRVSSPCSQAS